MADDPPDDMPRLNAEVNRRLIMALGEVMMRAIAAEAQRDLALADLKRQNRAGTAAAGG